MNNKPVSGYEQVVIALYAHNLVIALPLTILLIKIVVRFVTREPAKDIFRSVLVLPLDLLYIALGLLLTAIARRSPAFLGHYQSEREADFAGMVLCLGLFIAACMVTWLDRSVRLLWQKFYAAWNLAKSMQVEEKQMLLPGQSEIKRIAVIYLWMFAYWALMIPLSFVQAVVSIESLGSILRRVQ